MGEGNVKSDRRQLCHQVNKSFELGNSDESYPSRHTQCCLSGQPWPAIGRQVSEKATTRAATSTWCTAKRKTLPGNPMTPQSALLVGRSLRP